MEQYFFCKFSQIFLSTTYAQAFSEEKGGLFVFEVVKKFSENRGREKIKETKSGAAADIFQGNQGN